MNTHVKRLVIVILPLVLGTFPSLFVTAQSSWYGALIKPAINPPDWIFGPVWTVLYILMGIALFLVIESESSYRAMALKLFWVQLVLNVTWTFMFFGFESPLLGLINIVALWILIIATIFYFFAISKTAGWLLVPYIVWVSFAMFLNFSIWSLN